MDNRPGTATAYTAAMRPPQPRGSRMYLQDRPSDEETKLPFATGQLLKQLEKQPLYLQDWQIRKWIESDKVQPFMKELVDCMPKKMLYAQLCDTAAVMEWQMTDTLDSLYGLMHAVRGKAMEDCDDAFEAVALCAIRIAEASSAPDYLFDCKMLIPDGWTTKSCCFRIAPRLIIIAIFDLGKNPDGYFAKLLGAPLPASKEKNLAILDNERPIMGPHNNFSGMFHGNKRVFNTAKTSIMAPNAPTAQDDGVDDEDEEPVKRFGNRKRARTTYEGDDTDDDEFDVDEEDGGVAIADGNNASEDADWDPNCQTQDVEVDRTPKKSRSRGAARRNMKRAKMENQ